MKRFSFAALALLLTVSVFAATDDWAQHGLYTSVNQSLTQSPTVVFMGNSITQMWEEAHPDFFTTHNYACRGIGGQV